MSESVNNAAPELQENRARTFYILKQHELGLDIKSLQTLTERNKPVWNDAAYSHIENITKQFGHIGTFAIDGIGLSTIYGILDWNHLLPLRDTKNYHPGGVIRVIGADMSTDLNSSFPNSTTDEALAQAMVDHDSDWQRHYKFDTKADPIIRIGPSRPIDYEKALKAQADTLLGSATATKITEAYLVDGGLKASLATLGHELFKKLSEGKSLSPSRKLTRRDFLKLVGITSAGAAGFSMVNVGTDLAIGNNPFQNLEPLLHAISKFTPIMKPKLPWIEVRNLMLGLANLDDHDKHPATDPRVILFGTAHRHGISPIEDRITLTDHFQDHMTYIAGGMHDFAMSQGIIIEPRLMTSAISHVFGRYAVEAIYQKGTQKPDDAPLAWIESNTISGTIITEAVSHAAKQFKK